jgi:hypothetical protein
MSATQRRQLTGLFVFGLVVLSVALNVLLGFRATGFARSMFRRVVEGPAGFVAPSSEIDSLLADVPPYGDILLRFAGFGRADESAVEFIYYRSAYRLYPRRVLVAQPETVINRGRDILEAHFEPDEAWLRQHQVSCIIACERDVGGGIVCDVHK